MERHTSLNAWQGVNIEFNMKAETFTPIAIHRKDAT